LGIPITLYKSGKLPWFNWFSRENSGKRIGRYKCIEIEIEIEEEEEEVVTIVLLEKCIR
jgi:hypothetical protein